MSRCTDLNLIIKSDIYRYLKDDSFGSFLKNFLVTPGFRYSYFFRKCTYYKEKKNWLFYFIFKIFLKRYMIKYGIVIQDGTLVGKGLYIGHWGGIFVNQGVVIGENCNINQGVTIGQTNRGKRKGCPVIGNGVWMGAHSVIVGNIKVGNNTLIAPGAYVNFDLPDNAVVIGNPAKVVSLTGTEGYVVNTV